MTKKLSAKDKFAELLSRDLTTVQIRQRMGISNGAAQRLMCEIRNDLGVPVRD